MASDDDLDTREHPADDAHGSSALRPAYGPREGYERSRDEPLLTRVRDVLGFRSLSLIVAALVLQVAFIASYVGAFHHQQPHALAVSVVSDHNWQNYVSNQLNAIDGQPVWAYPETDPDTARTMLKENERQAVYLFDPNSKTDTLQVAGSTGEANAQALQVIFQQVAAKQHRQLKVQDIAPVQSGDARGLSGFYLTVGWLVGGYLMASLVGVRHGPKARNFRRMLWRLVACLGYAFVSGIAGALVVDQWIGALQGHFWLLVGIGTLLSATSSVFTMGMESVFGVIGIGVSILLFVVLGNPSAGGAYQYQLLPEPWRSMGQWLPNGAGVDAIRSAVYLDNFHLGFHLWVMAWWAAVGLLVFLLAANNTYWGFKRGVEADAEPAT